MYNVHARPVRDLRNNYAELSRMVKEHNHIIITNNGRDETVLMSIEDYQLCQQYLHRRYVQKKLAEVEEAADKPETWLNEAAFWEAVEDRA